MKLKNLHSLNFSILLFSFIFLTSFGIESVFSQNTDDKSARAGEIISRFQEAVGKNTKISEINSLELLVKSSGEQPGLDDRKIRYTTETKVGVMLPGRIRKEEFTEYPTNQTKSKAVLDGTAFARNSDVLVDGKPMQARIVTNLAPVSQTDYINRLKTDAFLIVLPITLQHSWYQPLNFKFVGVAESKDGKADVIETVTSGGAKYRLFFDQNSHLLLLMTLGWTSKTTNQTFERKMFVSDYREESGLLVAHKVIIQENNETVEERQIKSLKINPEFTADYFSTK